MIFLQSQEIDVLVGKDRETFYTSGLTLGSKKCSVLRDSLQDEGDWTMDIRTKSQGGEPTYNISVGRAGKGNSTITVSSIYQPALPILPLFLLCDVLAV